MSLVCGQCGKDLGTGLTYSRAGTKLMFCSRECLDRYMKKESGQKLES